MTETSLTSEQLAAKALVAKIAEEHGRVPEAVYAKLSPEGRRNLEVAILENAGSPILKVAESLSKSKAKTIFELLQNVDNCNYSKALARDEQPYVSFKEYPGKLVIEYNEDGFTEDDLKAICSVNKGGRTPMHGYIGETGFGFKSVFTLASKAHIQSNAFSFAFSHGKGGSGLGMISPKWEDPDETLGKDLTRITLFIPEHEDSIVPQRSLFSKPQISIERQMVKYQLQQIQDPMLLFMSKLRRIDVSFFTKDGHLETETSYTREGELSPAGIRKISTFGNMKGSSETRYYVCKHVINDVPPHENRTYQEGIPRTDATTQITLAFPTDEHDEPSTKSQSLFMFFPLSTVGFKFLVQADLVDIDATLTRIISITSARNKALFDGIVDAFCKAITEFSELPALQYRWMRWLPERTSLPADAVWTTIFTGLESRVKQMKIFKTLDDQQLGSLSTVRRFQTWWYDSKQDPLFKNSLPQLYLAKGYREEDLDLLEKYGLRMAAVNQCLDVIEADLSNDNDESCMKSASTTQEWHSLAAKALLILYNASTRHDDMSKGACLKQFRSLPLIPLLNNTWVSAESEPVFYAHCGMNIAIPRDLKVQLVDHSAALNMDRCQLFDALGVKKASVNSVRRSIQKIQQPSKADLKSLMSSFNHLRFLYLSQPEDDDQPLDYFVYDENLEKCYPWKEANGVYLPSTASCRPSELRKPAETCPEGFSAKTLHRMYLEDLPPGQESLWTHWLEKKLSVRPRLSLVEGTPPRLSNAYQYVHCHRRDLVFEMLRYYWPFDALAIMNSEDVQAHFQRLSFPTKDGLSNFLEDTYMPFPELERIADGYLSSKSRFPFLRLNEPISVESFSQWSFLVDIFGVRGYDGVNFYLTILQQLASDELEIGDIRTIINLYRMIETRCNESEDRKEAWKEVREAFEGDVLVLLPTDPIDWASPSDCLWAAPENMRSRIPLEHIYEDRFKEWEDLKFLQRFFKATISVPDVSWRHYLDELRFWSYMETEGEGIWPDFVWVTRIYGKLSEDIEHLPATARAEIKNAFEEERLIYEGPETDDEFGGWSSVKYTFWTNNPDDDSEVFLEKLYPDLHGFFVKFLGVQEYTLKTACEKLKELGKQEPPTSVAEVKDMIWTVNSLLQSSATSLEEIEDFSESKILPIKFPDGTVQLGTRQSRFIVLDKKDLGDVFSPQVEYLDFAAHEVKKLRSFMQWLGVTSKYVSSMVEKITLMPEGPKKPVQNLDRRLNSRAHAIFRIAVEFNSPWTKSGNLGLYRALRLSQVYETDEIFSELHLPEDAYETEPARHQSNLHIHEDEGHIELFIPSDALRQSICYSIDLPLKLLEWMVPGNEDETVYKPDPRALRLLTTVLNAPANIVGHILDEEDIDEGKLAKNIEEEDEDIYSAPAQSASAVTTATQPTQLLLTDSSTPAISDTRPKAQPKRLISRFENALPTRPHQRPKINLPPKSAYVPKPHTSTASTNKRRVKVKLPPASAYVKKDEGKDKEETRGGETKENKDESTDEDEDSAVSTGVETSDSVPPVAMAGAEGSETSTPVKEEVKDIHELVPVEGTTEKAEEEE